MSHWQWFQNITSCDYKTFKTLTLDVECHMSHWQWIFSNKHHVTSKHSRHVECRMGHWQWSQNISPCDFKTFKTLTLDWMLSSPRQWSLPHGFVSCCWSDGAQTWGKKLWVLSFKDSWPQWKNNGKSMSQLFPAFSQTESSSSSSSLPSQPSLPSISWQEFNWFNMTGEIKYQ